MLTCKEFDDFVIDYREGNLGPWIRFRCWLHMSLCRECKKFMRQYQSTINLGKDAFPPSGDELPWGVPEELVELAIARHKSRLRR